MRFDRGEKIHFKGRDSHLRGAFLCYVNKIAWRDSFTGEMHEEKTGCLVQQHGTGKVFVQQEPTEKNRGWG